MGIIIFFILSSLNLLILDFRFFRENPTKSPGEVIQTLTETKEDKSQPTPLPQQVIVSDSCPNSCLSQIYQATSSLKLTQPVSAVQSQADNVQAQSGVKEFFVSFGSGSSSADEWTDVSGLAAYIDSNQYGKIKTVTFEASLRIPTGNQTAYVRLYNSTDKHPVWFSEVSLEGGTPRLLISKPITLDTGNKLYQVQMKTQLKFSAILDQARVHITTY